jgi:hypothetical protein
MQYVTATTLDNQWAMHESLQSVRFIPFWIWTWRFIIWKTSCLYYNVTERGCCRGVLRRTQAFVWLGRLDEGLCRSDAVGVFSIVTAVKVHALSSLQSSCWTPSVPVSVCPSAPPNSSRTGEWIFMKSSMRKVRRKILHPSKFQFVSNSCNYRCK